MNNTAHTPQQRMEFNRRNWDERVAIHVRDTTGIYDVAALFRGADTLMPIECEEIGDIRGLRIAHLQCHFGNDSISLARRGGKVSALDFAPNAIRTARDHARRCDVEVKFVEGNVYEAPALLGRDAFDLVYVSWGATIWLPDIFAWAKTVASLLAAGGRLYFVDVHPALLQLEWRSGRLAFEYPRCVAADDALAFDEATTYAGDGRPLSAQRTYTWIHPVSDTINALISAGMRLEFIREHDRLPWPPFPAAQRDTAGMFRLPDGMIGPPMSYSLSARKQ